MDDLCRPLIHLELHTPRPGPAREFLARLSGWTSEPICTGAGTYLTLRLGTGPGLIGGGIVETPAVRPLWLPYAEVPDVGAATERARTLGARVVVAPREGPVGWRSVISSDAAGELALWQPKR